MRGGPRPELHGFASLEEEQALLVETLKELCGEAAGGDDGRQRFKPEEICVVARTAARLRSDYHSAFVSAEIDCEILEKDKEPGAGAVRLATMHRVKGLEFPCMVLAGISDGVVPLRVRDIEEDPTALEEQEAKEKSLLFVAATRARDRLVVTWAGTASAYLGQT